MARVKLKTKGVNNTLKGLASRGDDWLKAVLASIRTEAELIMTESQKQVPVSEKGSNGQSPGFLKNSKFIRKQRGQLSVELGYRADYAIFVHEADPGTNFRVGKRKFLEDPIKAASKGYAKRVAARAAKLMERKGGRS